MTQNDSLELQSMMKRFDGDKVHCLRAYQVLSETLTGDEQYYCMWMFCELSCEENQPSEDQLKEWISKFMNQWPCYIDAPFFLVNKLTSGKTPYYKELSKIKEIPKFTQTYIPVTSCLYEYHITFNIVISGFYEQQYEDAYQAWLELLSLDYIFEIPPNVIKTNYNNGLFVKNKLIELGVIKRKHIISLGYGCASAMSIDSIGYREGSFPVDWALSTPKYVFEWLQDLYSLPLEEVVKKFTTFHEGHVANPDVFPDLYQVNSYFFTFPHDDITEETFVFKYTRRITRFKKLLDSQKPILFVFFSRFEALDSQLFDRLINFLTSINSNVSLFVSHNDPSFESLHPKLIHERYHYEPDVHQNFVFPDIKLRKWLANRLKTLITQLEW